MTKKPRLGHDPFKEEPLSFIRDTREGKPEKLSKKSNPSNISNTNNPQEEEKRGRRATFIVREAHLEKIKALAYWERISIKRVLELALESYLKGKKIKPIPKGEQIK